MKIYVIEAHIDLLEEWFEKENWFEKSTEERKERNYNDVEVIKSLNPTVDFCIKEYEVIEEREDSYIRKNDGYYEEIRTYKQFDKNQEYDYADEVLNYPFFSEFNSRNIHVAIPTTKEAIEEAKEIVAKEIEKKFKIEMARMEKMISSAFNEKQWKEYKPHYEWEEDE